MSRLVLLRPVEGEPVGPLRWRLPALLPGHPDYEPPPGPPQNEEERRAHKKAVRTRWEHQVREGKRRALEAGINPATGRPLLEIVEGERSLTCGDCAFLREHGSAGRKTYRKCGHPDAVLRPTHGLRTDIGARWPACELFELRP